MKRLETYIFLITIFVSFCILAAGCDETSTNTNKASQTKGTMEVKLHDTPANYQQVNVFVKSVEVNNADDNNGWITINNPKQTYNLLALTNGANKVIGSKKLRVGTYEQIRLLLGSDKNNVVVDGQKYPLKIPSGQQTGIKLNINAKIKEDITYTLLLDFDAGRSVVQRGNKHAKNGLHYLLKPVISATNEAETGNIAGTINPPDSKSFVYAIANDDTLSSTKADTTDGSFKLIGLKEETYTVSADPTDSSYQATDTTGIHVTKGETNNMGTVEISH